MLEALVHWNGPPPGNQHFVEIEIPTDTSYEIVDVGTLPGWQVAGGDNHGKGSCKSNWDCTICHSCR